MGLVPLWIHPDDAAPRRIAAGDEVRVRNARGSFLAVAQVSDRVRPGVVASPKGRWPHDSKENATVNATVDERDSDMGGGATYHDNRVRVDKTACPRIDPVVNDLWRLSAAIAREVEGC